MKTQWISVLAILCLLAAALGVVTPALAAPDATFTVNTTNDTVDANPGNGACADSGGNCSLRAAVMEANALGGSNTINVPAGTFTLAIAGRGEDAAATGDLDVTTGALTMTGAGAGTCGNSGVTCIDANSIDRVFHVLGAGTLSLTGVTVTHGNPDDSYGGGIEVDGSGATLTLAHCLATENTTGPGTAGSDRNGGGIDIYQGSATISNSTISNNVAYEKGGGINNNSGTLEVTDSTISGNDANKGGGIYNQKSGSAPTLTISKSAVISNTTSGGSEAGGGIINDGTLNATNVTISGNTTGGAGGALADDQGAVETNLSYVTVANNTSGSGSGAADIYYAAFKPGSSIFAGNTGGNFAIAGGGSLVSQGYNLSDGVIPSAVGTDIQNSSSVGLSALANNGGPTQTMALGGSSAAIDKIANGVNGCVTSTSTDQRGAARADGTNRGGTACDIGAYEYASTAPLAVTLAAFTVNVGRAGVALAWETASEVDVLGFNLYRAAGGAAWTRLNAAMISSQAPGSPGGYSYTYDDFTAARGVVYRYRLATVGLNGQETPLETVQVTVPYLLWLPVVK